MRERYPRIDAQFDMDGVLMENQIEDKIVSVAHAYKPLLGHYKAFLDMLAKNLPDGNPFLVTVAVEKDRLSMFDYRDVMIDFNMIVTKSDMTPLGKISFRLNKDSFAIWSLFVDLSGNLYDDPACKQSIHNVHHHYQFQKLVSALMLRYLETMTVET